MAKTLKSIKIENKLLKLIDTYSNLMKSIYGCSPTFTTMVENGLGLYLLEQIRLLEIVSNNPVVMDNGVLEMMKITPEQKDIIQKLYVDSIAYRVENNESI